MGGESFRAAQRTTMAALQQQLVFLQLGVGGIRNRGLRSASVPPTGEDWQLLCACRRTPVCRLSRSGLGLLGPSGELLWVFSLSLAVEMAELSRVKGIERGIGMCGIIQTLFLAVECHPGAFVAVNCDPLRSFSSSPTQKRWN